MIDFLCVYDVLLSKATKEGREMKSGSCFLNAVDLLTYMLTLRFTGFLDFVHHPEF
jgi:hypothetical protein